jgi:TolB-like protein
MFRQIIFIVLLVLYTFKVNVYPEEIITIAVLDFKGTDVSTAVSSAVTDLIKSDFVNTKLFKILERQQINEILKEQGFQQTGCTEQSCAVEIGKLLSAKKILIGEVTKVGQSIIITARIVDIEQGVVEYSAKETAVSEDNILSSVSILTRNLIIQIKGESILPESLPAPDWIKVTDGNFADSIAIEWAQVPDAISYHIFRSLFEDKEYIEIAKTTKTIYYDYTIQPGKLYYYKVIAWGTNGEGISSKVDSGYMKLSSPDSLKASFSDDKVIKIRWGKVKGAEKYYIYKAASVDGDYVELDNVNDTSYSDSKALPGGKSWYKVKAWSSPGFSNYSNPVQGYRLSQDEEKQVRISDAKFGYYSRGLVPGWGQYYSGRTTKGIIYGSAFIVSCANLVYAQINYNKAKSDYDNIQVGTSDSKVKSIRKDYKDAAKYANISLGLVAAVYAFNLVDIFFLNKPDFSKDFSLIQSGNTFITFNLNNTYENTKEKQINFGFNIKF